MGPSGMVDDVAGAGRLPFQRPELKTEPRVIEEFNLAGVQEREAVNIKFVLRAFAYLILDAEQVRWFVPEHVLKGPFGSDEKMRRQNEVSDVRGYLRYDPATRTAIVTITGLKQPLEERIDLSSEFRR